MSTKKILVIVLMAVLASSVLAGASSLFSGRPSPSSIQQQDTNTELNNVVDFCMRSLPNRIPECDSQLRQTVNSVCDNNNDNLDACQDGRVNQYYTVRSAQSKTTNNTSTMP
jgi:hypothetical protein